MKAMHSRRIRPFTIAIFIIVAGFAAAAVFIALTAANADRAFMDISSENNRNAVIIDAGHGSPDGGAVGYDGAVEKDINLAISIKLKGFFESAGYKVIMTRNGDSGIYDKGCDTIREKKVSDIHNRFKIICAHPNALFISIHQNIYSQSKYCGTQVFFSPNNDNSKLLAESVQNSVTGLLQPDNSREVKKAGDNLYLLYNAESTAVMVECGFLSNPIECEKLQDSSYQDQMAFAIFSGVLKYNSDN